MKKALSELMRLMPWRSLVTSAPLIALLIDEDWHVRTHALSALGQIGRLSVFAPLVRALDDREPWLRHAAVVGLGRLHNVHIHDMLLERIATNSYVEVLY